MIEADIFKNLDHCKIQDFRYLMYLARNDEWVKVNEELYKVTITDVRETIQRPENGVIYYDKKYHPVSSQDDSSLKLLLSQAATSLDVFGVSSIVNSIEASKHKSLSDIKLNVICFEFTNLCIGMGKQDISLKIRVENYDSLFMKQLAQQSNDKSSYNLIREYAIHKKSANLDAMKNAVWRAAASGDHEQLFLLLNKFQLDLHDTYKKSGIIQIMFQANPEVDLPFKAKKADYKATLTVLMQNKFDLHRPIIGCNKQTSMDLCKQYQKTPYTPIFYHSYNPVHYEIFSAINAHAIDEMYFST